MSPSDCHVKNRHISASEPLEKLYDEANESYLAAVFARMNDKVVMYLETTKFSCNSKLKNPTVIWEKEVSDDCSILSQFSIHCFDLGLELYFKEILCISCWVLGNYIYICYP